MVLRQEGGAKLLGGMSTSLVLIPPSSFASPCVHPRPIFATLRFRAGRTSSTFRTYQQVAVIPFHDIGRRASLWRAGVTKEQSLTDETTDPYRYPEHDESKEQTPSLYAVAENRHGGVAVSTP